MVEQQYNPRPMLHFLCGSCMEPLRGDKLVLCAHHPTRQMTSQQKAAQRRLLDNGADVAATHRFHSPGKVTVDGPQVRVGARICLGLRLCPLLRVPLHFRSAGRSAQRKPVSGWRGCPSSPCRACARALPAAGQGHGGRCGGGDVPPSGHHGAARNQGRAGARSGAHPILQGRRARVAGPGVGGARKRGGQSLIAPGLLQCPHGLAAA